MLNICKGSQRRIMLFLMGLATNYMILTSIELSLVSSMALIDNMCLGDISTLKKRQVIN